MPKKILYLFDIDGTLTYPMYSIKQDMINALSDLDNNIDLGIVGGSDRSKAIKQIGLDNLVNLFNHCFHENGQVYYERDTLIYQNRLEDYINQNDINELLNFIMLKLSQINCPEKTGTFIERRSAMLNVSPVGRGCTQEQRDAFELWDSMNNSRNKLVDEIRTRFSHLPLTLACGGQISVDIFPTGADKTFCLQFMTEIYNEIHFFGDRINVGGNDYEIYNDPRVIGHYVKDPEYLINLLKNMTISN